MTGADAIVAALIRHDVDTVFGLPGIQLDPLFCALKDVGSSLRVVHFRHEQGAAYAALGYAQASGRPGVYTVVPGPGFLNTTAALSTAYACGEPVLALIGQIETASIGRGLGELHEIPDQSGILRSLTKWQALMTDPAVGPMVVAEAFARMRQGRPRPVGIEIPPDVLAQEIPGQVGEISFNFPTTGPETIIDPAAVQKAVGVLENARRPLIFVGGGARHAGLEIERLAERLQAAVASHRQGRGIVPTEHPYALNLYGASQLWRDADVVIAIGTRLHAPRRLWGLRPGQQLVVVDVDRAQALRYGRPDVAIIGDAKAAVTALLDALDRTGARRPSISAEIGRLKAASAAEFERRLAPQMAYIRALREALPEDAAFVADYTQVGYVATAALPLSAPRRLLTPGYQGTLGFGYATALGAQAAAPGRPTVALCGDGGFMFTAAEMATAIQHGLNVIAIVFNDGTYGNVQRMQRERYGGRIIATDLQNPDFVRFGESFGMASRRATNSSELGVALKEAVQSGRPALIEVVTDPRLPDPWPLLAPRIP